MPAMKITPDTAMRARDVSRPHPEHEMQAQATDSGEAGTPQRPVTGTDSASTTAATACARTVDLRRPGGPARRRRRGQ